MSNHAPEVLDCRHVCGKLSVQALQWTWTLLGLRCPRPLQFTKLIVTSFPPPCALSHSPDQNTPSHGMLGTWLRNHSPNSFTQQQSVSCVKCDIEGQERCQQMFVPMEDLFPGLVCNILWSPRQSQLFSPHLSLDLWSKKHGTCLLFWASSEVRWQHLPHLTPVPC